MLGCICKPNNYYIIVSSLVTEHLVRQKLLHDCCWYYVCGICRAYKLLEEAALVHNFTEALEMVAFSYLVRHSNKLHTVILWLSYDISCQINKLCFFVLCSLVIIYLEMHTKHLKYLNDWQWKVLLLDSR